jgi:hypothetical protein
MRVAGRRAVKLSRTTTLVVLGTLASLLLVSVALAGRLIDRPLPEDPPPPVLDPKPGPPREGPFELRRRLRSSDLHTRMGATSQVLTASDRYAWPSVRLALANASRDLDPNDTRPIGELLAGERNDTTTRADAAMALGRIGALRDRTRDAPPDPDLDHAFEVLIRCASSEDWPLAVRRSCAEAIGLARLRDQADLMLSISERSSEDALVAVAAMRSYTRLTGSVPRGAVLPPIDLPPGEVH